MPVFSFTRLLMAVLSLAVVAVAIYLLWSWQEGVVLVEPDGALVRVRQDWRLWTALALGLWSILGRFLLLPLLARRDTDPTHAKRGDGRQIAGASGSSLYVEDLGPRAGPVVILTHGWGLDSTIWFYAKRDLSKTFRVIAWDLPGLGKSRVGGAGGVSLEDFAADLTAIIDLAEGAPVVLVGHSIGGMTLQTLVRDHPTMLGSNVAGLVLVNTTYTNPLHTMILSGLATALRWPVLEPLMRVTVWLQPLVWLGAWQSYLSGSAHLANRIGFGRYVTRSQLEHNTLLATRNPPAVLARGNLAMFRWDATDALADLRLPVLILSGDADIVTKLEASETIDASTPEGRLQVVEGVNHMGFLERHEVYNAAIAKFSSEAFSRLAPRSNGSTVSSVPE